MDLTQVLQLAGFVFGLLTVAGTLYWRIQVMVKEVRDEANLRAEASLALAHDSQRMLGEHRLHVAETYLTKTGMREFTDQIMESIGTLGTQIASVSGRIDRLMERPPVRTTTGRS